MQGTDARQTGSQRAVAARGLRVLEQRAIDLDAVAVAEALGTVDNAPPDADRRAREIMLRKFLRDSRPRDGFTDRDAFLDLERDQLLALRQREYDLDAQRAYRAGNQP